MRLALIHPAIGRRSGERYMRTWQMESLPAALIAGLTPRDVQIAFHDDRMEAIPYDRPVDLVALSVETYTARRAYQIASEFRRRGIPVAMGGFHPTLAPDEVADYAEAVIVGEGEALWPQVIDDFRHGQLQKFYRARKRPPLSGVLYERSIFRGKRYLPLGLIETGRGCRFPCEFCAIQTFFQRTHNARPTDEIVAELGVLKTSRRFFFFVDDNFAADLRYAKELLTALIPLNIRWVTQLSINAAHDEELLCLLARSGCKGVLIGFESLDPDTLRAMNKRFNMMRGGYEAALSKLARYGIRVYATFVFGYDNDTAATFRAALEFALRHRFYIAAFNHLTPFPGTPLYKRLEVEGRLLYERWWLDARYSYNRIPFRPARMTPDALQASCLQARRGFYGLGSILKRGLAPVNRADAFMFRNFFLLNWMHRAEVSKRNHFPLGDAAWGGPLLKAS
jgi:radical SAM superfamily enzyme YgiQ (UPF0313 family)